MLSPKLKNQHITGRLQWELKDVEQTTATSFPVVQPHSSVNTGYHAIVQIRAWLQSCEREHTHCKRVPDSSNLRKMANVRLIHVGTASEPTVRLVCVKELSSWPAYTTLSHRWTDTTKATQLQWNNIQQYHKSIEIGSWPPVYKQALHITRQLGIQHLWIDSICIVQDSNDSLSIQDWDEQSGSMDGIYAKGTLNLAEIGGVEFEGFTTSRSLLTEVPCVLARRNADGTTQSSLSYYLVKRDGYLASAVNSAPLSQRGWVFQERILSKRAVHFGHQLYWECASLSACETFPEGSNFLGQRSEL